MLRVIPPGEEEIIEGLQRMGRTAHDAHGNLSARDGDKVTIKPSGVPYDEIDLFSLARVRMDGGIIHAPLKPSVDLPHHLSIYRRHPWVEAICHTHSPHAVAFAMLEISITCYCTEHADYFGGDIRCLPYCDLSHWGDKIMLAEGERAVLLGRHGVLAVGRRASEAVEVAIAVENVAQKTYLAKTLAHPCYRLREMAPAQIESWNTRYRNDYGQR